MNNFDEILEKTKKGEVFETLKNVSFCHYTSASTAVKIIKDKKIWMRNSRLMNDYSEISHGVSLVERMLHYSKLDPVKNIFLKNNSNLFDEAIKGWRRRSKDCFLSTYISCLSEWEGEEGRLSMWRAYGGGCGVSIIFKNDIFIDKYEDHTVFIAKANYSDSISMSSDLIDVFYKYDEYVVRGLCKFDEDYAFNLLENYLIEYSITSKHNGFSEEKEWRIWCNEDVFVTKVPFEIEIVNGVPQKIYKIDFSGSSSLFPNLSIERVIDRIVVGPSHNQEVVRGSFVELLKIEGVVDADEKVVLSPIPLRV